MCTLIDRIVEWAIAACLGVMTCIVCVSVVFRYVLSHPLTWSDELASLLFAWLTFVGAYIGARFRSHITIDTLVILLPARVRRILTRLEVVGILFLLMVFLWQGIRLTITTWSEDYPGMNISRGYLYLSLPVGACLMAFAVIQAWREASLRTPAEEEHS